MKDKQIGHVDYGNHDFAINFTNTTLASYVVNIKICLLICFVNVISNYKFLHKFVNIISHFIYFDEELLTLIHMSASQ